ncbi:MAG: DUF485 domain-containing protein [Candidatus Atribacteria bacterium]|nr:DUF485 domain-containing protein [Candidatus Atribacteria bacterium]
MNIKKSDSENMTAYKVRIGMYMILLYALVYFGFIVINISNPFLMERIIFGGLNLALVYGIGLIIFALILALIYNSMCSKKEAEFKDTFSKKGDK